MVDIEGDVSRDFIITYTILRDFNTQIFGATGSVFGIYEYRDYNCSTTLSGGSL